MDTDAVPEVRRASLHDRRPRCVLAVPHAQGRWPEPQFPQLSDRKSTWTRLRDDCKGGHFPEQFHRGAAGREPRGAWALVGSRGGVLPRAGAPHCPRPPSLLTPL